MKAVLATILATAAVVTASPVAVDKRQPHDCTGPTNFYYANNTKEFTYSSDWHILTDNGSFDYDGVEAYSGSACA